MSLPIAMCLLVPIVLSLQLAVKDLTMLYAMCGVSYHVADHFDIIDNSRQLIAECLSVSSATNL